MSPQANTARILAYGQPRETAASAQDILSAQSALTDLLIEEADFMDGMQLGQVRDLQERKLKLTALLERYTRYMQHHPEAAARITAEEKTALAAERDRFQHAMKKNYATLLVARAVNRAVVKCVTQTTSSKQGNPIYNARGATRKMNMNYKPVSITLNETV